MPNLPPLPFCSDKPCLLPCATPKHRETWQLVMGTLAMQRNRTSCSPAQCTHPLPNTATRNLLQLQSDQRSSYSPSAARSPCISSHKHPSPSKRCWRTQHFPFAASSSLPQALARALLPRGHWQWGPSSPSLPSGPSPGQRAPVSRPGASLCPTTVGLRPEGAPQRGCSQGS